MRVALDLDNNTDIFSHRSGTDTEHDVIAGCQADWLLGSQLRHRHPVTDSPFSSACKVMQVLQKH